MSLLIRLLFQYLLRLRFLTPLVRPLTRVAVSLVAIPLFRFFLRRVAQVESMSRELEKDLEQWFRGAVLLLLATRNMEDFLFAELLEINVDSDFNLILTGARLMLAIGVVEGMPDQALFSIIHPGPSMLLLPKGRRLRGARENWRPLLWGCLAKHLNRSSPVFAILCVLFDGVGGWACYVLAVVQYLIIALVSSRDAALDALDQFDRELHLRRAEVLARVGQTDGDSSREAEETVTGDKRKPPQKQSRKQTDEQIGEVQKGRVDE